MPGPFGWVTEDALHVELTKTPGLPPGEQAVETRLALVRNHVDSLRSALERFQAELHAVGLRALEQRREQAELRRRPPPPPRCRSDDVTTRRRHSWCAITRSLRTPVNCRGPWPDLIACGWSPS